MPDDREREFAKRWLVNRLQNSDETLELSKAIRALERALIAKVKERERQAKINLLMKLYPGKKP